MPKKIQTVDEVLTEINGKKFTDENGVTRFNYGRFNRRDFNNLIKAILNDPEFKVQAARYTKNGLVLDDVEVSKDFRKFLKDIVMKVGVSEKDASEILDPSFTIDYINDGFYELMSTAMRVYMEAGNRFDMMPTENFKASLYVKPMPKTKKTRDVRNPITGEDSGTYEIETEEYNRLFVKSSIPKWLVKRIKIK